VICEEETEFVLNIIQMKVRLQMATVCANTVQCIVQHSRQLAMAEQ
jgi:hypothetical protein